MKVSNCCGVPGDATYWYKDVSFEDVDICPCCYEHCEYEELADRMTNLINDSKNIINELKPKKDEHISKNPG